MGVIKDVADLVKELVDRVENQKFAADLREIQTMIAGIGSENAELTERNIQLTKENGDLKRTIDSLNEKVETSEQQADSSHATNSTPIKTLSAEEEQILKCLVEYGQASLEAISEAISLDVIKTEYWLDQLQDRNMVSIPLAFGSPGLFYLDKAGRGHLVENGLI